MPVLTSRHNPIVARFRAVARAEMPSLILVDGVHLVADAVQAGIRLHEVAALAGATARDEIAMLIEELERAHIEVVTASPPVMAAISPVRSPSPIVAIADRPAVRAESVYRPAALVLATVDVQDPGNLGAIVRVAEAAGASGVVATGISADPFGWKALRGSMGSAFRLPVAHERDVDLAIAAAREHGCRIVATAPRGGRSLFDLDLASRLFVLIGGEGGGLSERVLSDADERLTIPMRPPVESLNAAVTAALVVYEAERQRNAGHPSGGRQPKNDRRI